MVNNNVQNVKFLRNGSVFTPSADPVKTAREVALAAMNGQLNSLADGTAILGRYNEGIDGSTVKTLVGFAYVSGETRTLTVLDVDGAGADVNAKILAAIQALDAEITSSNGKNVQVKVTEVDGKITAVNITTDNTVNSGDVDTAITNAINELDGSVIAETGYFVKSVTEADGKISGTTEALPSVNAISEVGKPITAVSESLGSISATAGTINAEYVDVSYSAITATNVKGALAEIADEINAMDKPASAEDGKVVTTVSETDGVVSETKANVKDLQLGGYSKSSSTGAIASTDTINEALSKLENKAAAITIANEDGSINVTTGASGTDINVNIKSGEHVLAKTGDAGLYTDIKLSAVTPSSTTVKEEYSLVATDGTVLGTNIKIYKDSSIVSITYITDPDDSKYQNLKYEYIDVSGNTQTEYVDMSSLVIEAEFQSGVTADASGVVHGVVDTTSEKNSSNNSFLTVGTDGFKVDGIKDEIDAKINALDATVGSTTVATGKHVAVEVVEDAGKLTAVTVTEDDIASATALTAEIAARKAVDGQDGQTYAANSGKAYISGATSLNDADIKLNDALASLDADVIKSVNVNNVALTETSNAVNVQISSVKAENTDASPIVVTTDQNSGAVTLQIQYLDCGLYS